MAAGGGQVEPDRLDPAKLQAYPKIIDIDIDILIPQFIDKWKVQLHVALRSRYRVAGRAPTGALRETNPSEA